MKDYWNNLTTGKRNLLKLIPAFLILIALPLTVWVAQQTQNLQQNAALVSSGPITATSGQVIRGVKISNPLGPCITVSNVSNVIIDNVELGPCAGNGVKISGSGATGIQVTNSFISTGRSGSSSQNSGVGVFIFGGPSNILVQGNTFERNESSVYAETASGVKINRNRSKNPLGPFPRGQHAQFNNVNGGEINDNFGESITGQSDQEDAINVFNSDNIVVARNYIVGGDSPSGCGVIADWSGGTNNQLIDNIVIRTAQCGVAIAGGTNHVIRGNKVLDTNITGGSGNIGIYVANYSGGVCSGHSAVNNIVSNLLPNGTYNDYYNAGSCGPVTTSGNIFGSTARSLLTPENQKLPTPTPLPTIGPVPATPTPTPTTTPVSCGTSLQSKIDAAPAGATVDLGTCTYTGTAASLNITKPVTILRGTLKPSGFDAVSIRANDVTIDGTTFDGGGWTIKVYGVDRTKILNSIFRNMRETSIRLVGPSVDDMLIQGNTIIQSVNTGTGYSPISGVGPGAMNKNLIIRGNTIDNGPAGIAHFGVEVWDNIGLIIEGNNIKGAGALISIPRSDGTIVRNNTFDLTQAFWGMELADIDNAKVLNNTATGPGANVGSQWRAFIQLHPGSGTVNNITIQGNRLTNNWGFVNAAGQGHIITDNCLNNVGRMFEGSFTGPITNLRNGACGTSTSTTPTPTSASTSCSSSVVGFTSNAVNIARDAAGAGGVVCFPAGTYTGDLTASVTRQTWQFDPGVVVAGRLSITGSGATIRGQGAEVRRPPTTNEWSDGYNVIIQADDVTVQDLKVRGGGFGVGVFGRDRVKLLRLDIANTYSAALAVWSSTRGTDDLLVQDSRFINTSTPTHRVSSVIGRNDNPAGQPPNLRPVFRNVYMDQGPEGHFGMELFESPGMIIEGGEYRGGEVLISPGRSHGLKVRNAKLHLGGRTHSAIEVALINDVEISGNIVDGPGSLAWVTNYSERTNVHHNYVNGLYTIVNAEQRAGYEGKDHRDTDNCMTNTQYEWRGLIGSGTIIARNGPCSTTVPTSSPTPTTTAFTPTPTPTATSQACDVNAVGVNKFAGCLYDGTQFETLVSAAPSGNILLSPVSSTQTALSFDWGSGTPNAAVGTEHWSIRWKGNFTFPAGTYTFIGGSDDGIRVRFNGVTKIDVWKGRAYGESSFTETFTQPTTIKIEIDYNEYGVPGKVNFRWTGQNPTPTSTPTTAPTPNPTPPPTVCTADAKLCPDGSYVSRTGPSCAFAPCPAPTEGPTATPVPGNTVFVFNLGLDGIGSTGDNSNPSDGNGSNKNPLHKTRNINIQVFDSNNNLAAQKTGSVLYNPSTGKFTGSVDLGSSFETGFYIVKVKSDGYLTKHISGIQNITASQTNQISYINLITGDINNDNILNILDYNIFLSCSVFSSSQSTCNTNSSFKTLSDLNDDGSVDQNDYNLFIREVSTRVGQ